MADSLSSFANTHFIAPELQSRAKSSAGKSYTQLVSKSLLIIFVLVIIPSFPSKAPEFISHRILIKFWELIHLLFIGIAVCYGLFSRKTGREDTGTHSRIDHSQAYLSGLLPLPPIFDNGFDNFCDSDEKHRVQTGNFQNFHTESMGIFTNGFSNPDAFQDFRSLMYKSRSENPHGSCEEKMTQTWNSRSFQSESMVVLADGNCGFNQWGKLRSSIDYKPLCLPVRSLRSRVLDCITTESSIEGGSISGSSESEGKIRGGVSTDLGENFGATVSPSPIPWRSRSSRVEMREAGDIIKAPSRSNHHSLEAFEFDSLKSQSFRCPKSSGHSSLPSPSNKSFHFSPISPEILSTEMEDVEERKSLYGSSMHTPHSPVSPMIGEAPSVDFRTKRSSNGTSSGMNVQRNFKPKHAESRNSGIEDSLSRRKLSIDSLDSDIKSFKRISLPSPPNQPFYLPSISPEIPRIEMEDLEKRKSINGCSVHTSHAPVSTLIGEAPVAEFKTKLFSSGTSSEMNVQRNSKAKLVFRNSGKEDSLSRQNLSVDSLDTDIESSKRSSLPSPPKKPFHKPSVFPEMPGVEVEDLEKRKSLYGSSMHSSHSLASPVNVQRNSKAKLEFRNSGKEDSLSRQNLSVDSLDTDIESSKRTSLPSPPKKPFHKPSVFPEMPGVEVEDLEKRKSLYGSSMHSSHLLASLVNGETPFIDFSSGTSPDVNVQRNSKTKSEEFKNSRREDSLSREKLGVDSLDSGVKSEVAAKVLPRGKSVRTIRSGNNTMEAKKCSEIHTDCKVGMNFDKYETTSMENLMVDDTKQKNAESTCMPNSSLFMYPNGEKQDLSDSSAEEAEKESGNESDILSSDAAEARSDISSDTESKCNEVDRKAGEFIAKFREQIRLQKIASIKGYTG